MHKTDTVVDYLNKIHIELESGSSPGNMGLTPEPVAYRFIYGVASEGITAFEKQLFAKPVGYETTIHIREQTVREALGHLRQPLLDLLPAAPSFFMQVRITGVEPADNREVIQAIAAGASSQGCDCGCGCA